MGNTVPEEVRSLIGDAIKDVETFWNDKHELFSGKSPKEVWESGDKERVIDFILSAKSGDMA